MEWKQVPLGPLQTNSYVIYNDQKKALIVDPGGDGDSFVQWLENENMQPQAILLTHAHFDHIGGVEEVRNAFNVPVYVHKNEENWLTDASLNGSGLFPGIEPISANKADEIITKEGPLEVGDFNCQVYETPGHSPGSVSYYFPEDGVIFSGDVIFRGGVGRTDLPGGDENILMDTIHHKMLSLPDETSVANGHGPVTTIGTEKETNPFINGFGW
ncbi:MBL fold metallo-hydrolase [Bacillus shivajii]|uniref:MBL fold metallo-hydrolase n=1 Tax=Bacillus shivajii TaxID=1983719 RepID=UPI001CFA8B89|nr:MBL fold metallo-hydrolase [Bacillus shivajii]UCZ54566.1 MBL fold metallo-hydrolase [Bacillus shivajii]